MFRLAAPWNIGVIAGLVLATIVLIGHLDGWHTGQGALGAATRYLDEVPQEIFGLVRETGEAGRWIILFVWWALIGGVLGWAFGTGTLPGILFGLFLTVVLIAAHWLLGPGGDGSFDRVIRSIERAYEDIIRGLF